MRSGSSRERRAQLAFGFFAQHAAGRIGVARGIGQRVFERLVLGERLRDRPAQRSAQVCAHDVARDLVNPGRELSELRIERPQVRVGAQERFLRKVGNVGAVAQACADEVCDSALVALDQHREKFPFSLANS